MYSWTQTRIVTFNVEIGISLTTKGGILLDETRGDNTTRGKVNENVDEKLN